MKSILKKKETMMMKTDWKLLKRVAEHSPKEYADQIRNRYTASLNALVKLRKKVLAGTSSWIDHRHILKSCSHCSQKMGLGFACNLSISYCIWSKIAGKKMGCVLTKMYGVKGVPKYITLSRDGVEIAPPFHEEDYKIAKGWLKTHIDWTNKYEWGKYYE